MFKTTVTIFLLATTMVTTGCAFTRSEIRLAASEATEVGYPVTKTTAILVRSVTDERIYEEAPGDPSTPSLGHEGAAKASADIKARAFARKRNGFGKAMGEVLLERGQTVSNIVRDNLVRAFQQAGYRTTADPAEAGASPIVVDAHIRQFWAWSDVHFGLPPKLNANIETSLVTSNTTSPTIAIAHAENSTMIVDDINWAGIVVKVLKDYRTQVAEKFASLP